MARTEGVEPTLTVLETVALPLNYIRIFYKNGVDNGNRTHIISLED